MPAFCILGNYEVLLRKQFVLNVELCLRLCNLPANVVERISFVTWPLQKSILLLIFYAREKSYPMS